MRRTAAGRTAGHLAASALLLCIALSRPAHGLSHGVDREGASSASRSDRRYTDAQAVDALLAIDRSHARRAASEGLAGLVAMFDQHVVMPLPGGRMALGKGAAEAGLRANAANVGGKFSWWPIRGGIAADRRHGFTMGYMDATAPDGSVRALKYLSFWKKDKDGWRVAAFKRAPHPAGARSAPMPPSLPGRALGKRGRATSQAKLRADLIAREKGFSDAAHKLGLATAFAQFGHVDATNLGQGPGFTVGAGEIGREIGAGNPPALMWSADSALVAGSGDLGVTWGYIHLRGPAASQAAPIPFFTIWRRDDPREPWRYVAE